ncbi:MULTISPECIES: WhiB family transcriptional regulator [unclassified Streptomyces]|uniref:WhiB family transcriptional regulator n=1 Tax=unclassified Streptomyces TaxID=2593676 RepID=UPI000F6D91C4|nr:MULTISPECIES: WhiB family transcriptional regulator [unclassified Streptomyces]AZM92743.1 WhiB family transcriptional regulator [Streptomyces sp. W1SF4]RSS40157.1 WhiB family transcriptional regulator [Streptomyces sp. WAC07061]
MPNLSLLPGPAHRHWAWQAEALCQEVGAEQFYGPWHERRKDREQRDAQAKRLCSACPVREVCLRHALSTQEPYGVWGGLTARERRKLRTGYRPAGAPQGETGPATSEAAGR